MGSEPSLKTLTICQPWAHLIANGRKWVENRTWYTQYRGPLLIHAGKSRKWFSGETDWLMQDDKPEPQPDDCVFGAIIARCNLVACVRSNDRRVVTHPFAEGPWCWVLSDIQTLPQPIELRGQQGLFEVSPSILEGGKPLIHQPANLFGGCDAH